MWVVELPLCREFIRIIHGEIPTLSLEDLMRELGLAAFLPFSLTYL